MTPRRPRRRGRLLAGAAALAVVLAGGATWTVAAGDSPPEVHRQDRMAEMPADDGEPVAIDTSYFTAGDPGTRRPAVLLGHGFGGSKDDLRAQAETLARDGYAVLTWSARGFGASGGRVGLNDPEREVADVSRLIDWLAEQPEVLLDAEGDPRVGMSGASYGGAIALLAAGHDDRVDAVAPRITYWNLADALFPDGVFKKLWAGIFFTTGEGCANFSPELCAMYERVAVNGAPDEEATALLTARSPAAVADRIDVPALIVQGQHDSLFPLNHADAMATAIEANGAPVAVDWTWSGHDGGISEDHRIEERVTRWFDRYLKDDPAADTGPAFRVTRISGIDTTNGDTLLRGAEAAAYPGLGGDPRKIGLTGSAQDIANPAGGTPPSISAVPGLGSLSGLSTLGMGLALDFPGQFASFDSAPLAETVRVTGSPAIRLHIASDAPEAVLFLKVYDVSPDGSSQSLPAQLVTPVRVTGTDGEGTTAELPLPAIDYPFEAGHRMRLVVSTTDLGYASPPEPATHTVTLADDDAALTVPTAPQAAQLPTPLPWWTWALPVAAAALAALLLLTGRHRPTRRTPAPDPQDPQGPQDPQAPSTGTVPVPAQDPGPHGGPPADSAVPLHITGLTKRYAGSVDRYAVRDLGFSVERGQVLGLLGPNGAGKTTTLRMLMGLITPDAGEIRVFGQRITPGAPVLSRVGAFVEGAGFLPHLSGRANLELYWRATGRPAADAHLDEALEIAGLGDALARAVRTYSQGMRQRLAIAQAMLGLPDLLILDEPTNGLDPPQIREMREVMIRYAAQGRTVIVSSHLLAEVEQTCTHLVVMDRGRLLQAGPVAEIAGTGDTLLATLARPVPDELIERIAGLPGVTAVRRAPTDDEGLLIQLAGTTPADLLPELVRLEVPVAAIAPHRRLEDAFLTLIGGAA
ncbi:alpha/beta fold hydrolase [Streptomyces harbinensis]|uniref:alpha/beta fold hydrolase n=1 Tax=Streptomyces harbinensis TaxID=1176198 RepID=UPI0037198B7C